MKAIHIMRAGGPDVLELRDVPSPRPGPGGVLIRVRAAGINFADLVMRMGRYVGAPPFPFVPGYEVAGEVEEAGSGVTTLKKGDRVVASVRFGGYAEQVVTPATHALPLPAGATFEEAAALPVNYLTAYHALYVLGNLRPGAGVLAHQAAGGVGLAVLQLAKLRGATVYGTASPSKHAFLKARGLDHAIDYRSEDFEARVKALTGGKGVQLVLDPVGGVSFRKSYRCLAPAGTLVCYGASAASEGKLKALWTYLSSGVFSPLQFMLGNKGIVGFHLGILDDAELLGGEMRELAALWSAGKIRPHVDRAFPAEQAAQAHQYIHDRKNVGKVVLTF
jgi:NADPH:quinone reductase-like Zn-dependent oxidoreductase